MSVSDMFERMIQDAFARQRQDIGPRPGVVSQARIVVQRCSACGMATHHNVWTITNDTGAHERSQCRKCNRVNTIN